MSGEGPLSTLLAAWEFGASVREGGGTLPRPSHCGGALFRMTRSEAARWAPRVRFETDFERLPEDQRWDIRVVCNADVAPGRGLCAHCHELERDRRRELAEAASQVEAAKPRRGFREGAR